jgi:HEAT repeat protein
MLASKAAYAAGVIGGDAGVDVLEEAADSPVTPVRVATAAAVAELSPQLGASLLIRLMADADRGVRRQAIRSAVGRPDAALRVRIEAISTSDPDARLRAEAAQVLQHP